MLDDLDLDELRRVPRVPYYFRYRLHRHDFHDLLVQDRLRGHYTAKPLPLKSPRWQESQKLLTGEVNAAVDGLYAGGAREVVVADLHDSSRSLSALTIDSRARLLQGEGIPPTLGLDSSY